jgi:hypothetical protein
MVILYAIGEYLITGKGYQGTSGERSRKFHLEKFLRLIFIKRTRHKYLVKNLGNEIVVVVH